MSFPLSTTRILQSDEPEMGCGKVYREVAVLVVTHENQFIVLQRE